MTIDAEIIFAFVIGSIAVGRGTRLIVDDDMPVFKWFREKWVMFWVDRNKEEWGELVTCAFCVAIWLSAASTAWAFMSDLHWTWWALHIFLAGAYVAAMVNVRDVPVD